MHNRLADFLWETPGTESVTSAFAVFMNESGRSFQCDDVEKRKACLVHFQSLTNWGERINGPEKEMQKMILNRPHDRGVWENMRVTLQNIQRLEKRWTCFALHQPGRASLNFVRNLGPVFLALLCSSLRRLRNRATHNRSNHIFVQNLVGPNGQNGL